MAIAKVIGIETEFGIAGGPEQDPIVASSIIVNAYAQRGMTHINWDFEGETPGEDARGIAGLTAFAPIVETQLANTVLANGARLYVDHAHPEYSSPECRTPLEAVRFDAAGEEVLRRAQDFANDTLDPAQAITIYKNNSDGKGNSYGCHENYLVARSVEFADLVRALVPHFVSRQIVVGAGKVGVEIDQSRSARPAFQVSQRAEFFEEVVGLETTLKRPIVNTRDETHGDAERFRRLHVIIGDANLSQYATAVKLGATALLLAALEDQGLRAFPAAPRDPVRAVRAFAADPTLRVAVECVDDRTRTAWDFQDELWALAQRYTTETGASAVAEPDEVHFILDQWREMLDGVRDDPDAVADRVDWVAKKRIVDGYRERYGLNHDDARLRAIDLQYHDLRPGRSLAARVGLRRIVGDDAIEAAILEPPASTRAFFRGQCVKRFPGAIAAANWDSVVFDLGDGPLQRVPMPDPLRGTAALTAHLFETNSTAIDLLSALGG